jgi:hypothetical protein
MIVSKLLSNVLLSIESWIAFHLAATKATNCPAQTHPYVSLIELTLLSPLFWLEKRGGGLEMKKGNEPHLRPGASIRFGLFGLARWQLSGRNPELRAQLEAASVD